MTQPQWIRHNKEQAQRIVRQLSDRSDAVVFSQDLTEVSWRSLPFYTNFRLYRLVNYATMPVFSMTYLSDGKEYFGIDGTANPIYTVNEKDPVHLREDTVIAYLEFFFSHVQGSEGDVFLLKDPKRMPFMDTFSADQQKEMARTFKPLKVTADKRDGSFKVTGTLYYGSVLLAATIGVTSDGKISFQSQDLLMSGIHFPDSPYTANWIEG